MKHFKIQDIFTVSRSELAVRENRSSVMCGDIMRVSAKSKDYIWADTFDRKTKTWSPCTWTIEKRFYNFIRLPKNIEESV